MRTLLVVLLASSFYGTALAMDCGKVSSTVEGPITQEYKLKTQFGCQDFRASGTGKEIFEEVKKNLLKDMAVTSSPRTRETERELSFEFVGKSKGALSCNLGGGYSDSSFKVVLRFQKNTNEITISRSNTGPIKVSNGQVTQLEFRSKISVKSSSQTRLETLDTIIKVTGLAANFPGRVKGTLKEKFENLATCIKTELESR